MQYKNPNTDGSVVSFKASYDNLIGGAWVAPVKGNYFDNISPVNGKPGCKIPRATAEDIEKARDAARADITTLRIRASNGSEAAHTVR